MTLRASVDPTSREKPRAEASQSQPEGQPVIEARNLTVTYGDGTVAVDHVSFDVSPGERIAVVGESGSGKTTLGLAIAGFLMAPGARIEADVLRFHGEDLHRTVPVGLPVHTPGISMVLQDAMTSLDPVWSIGQQLVSAIRAHTRLKAGPAKLEAAEWLRRVGLQEIERVLKAKPYELSGGMRQRAMLAIALCGSPRLVIADEPTSALDASLAAATMELMVDLAERAGSSLIVVSHDIDLTLRYCDRILVMYRGEVVEQGPGDRLKAAAEHPYTKGLLQCVPTLDNAALDTLPTLDSLGFSRD